MENILAVAASISSIIAAVVAILAARKARAYKDQIETKISNMKGGIVIADSQITGNRGGGIRVDRNG